MDLREVNATTIRHPWETARFKAFERVLGPTLGTVSTVLDVGAGDAWFSTELALRSPVALQITCCDTHGPEDSDLGWVAKSRVRRVRALPAAEHDLVLLLDVAEHVEDDRAFLDTIVQKHLKVGGALLFSVPAWPMLWTSHDAYLHHHRRYRPAQARALLEGAGLKVVQSGGLFHSLLAPRGLVALAERLWPRAEHTVETSHAAWSHGQLVTRALGLALEADARIGAALSHAGVEAPGLSWWALCAR